MNFKKFLWKIAIRVGMDSVIYRLYQNIVSKPPFPDKLLHKNNECAPFITDNSAKIKRYNGIRDAIKPGWREMLKEDKNTILSMRQMKHRLRDWRFRIEDSEKFLRNHSVNIFDKKVLEIGAYDGATAFALALSGAHSVVATDVESYYLNQEVEGIYGGKEQKLSLQKLKDKRVAYSQVLTPDVYNKVYFVDDDICSSDIDSGSADIILSWEVVEHLARPESAFKHMFRLLKPGGIAFHEYNPFYSIDGGHSLCTLDFPWGHARLSAEEFKRYVGEFRQEESEIAVAFFEKNLNRLTLKDTEKCAKENGFEVVAHIPWPKKSHLDKLTGEILSEVVRRYPTAQIIDLISPRVWLLIKKPE